MIAKLARVTLEFTEIHELIHHQALGLTRVDGDWVTIREEIDGEVLPWTSWPRQHVINIVWLDDPTVAETASSPSRIAEEVS